MRNGTVDLEDRYRNAWQTGRREVSLLHQQCPCRVEPEEPLDRADADA